MRPKGRAASLLGAGAAGAIYGVAQVGFGAWPLVFVCLALLWRCVARESVATAAAGGAVFGFVAYTVAMGWLLPTIARFAGGPDSGAVGGVLWSAQGLWIALGFTVALAATGALRVRGVAWLLAGPAPLVLVESLQPRVFSAGVGVSLVHAPAFAQLAELGGPLGLTLFVACVNAGVANAWESRARRVRVTRLGGVVAVLVLAALWGMHRSETWSARAKDGPALEVGIVQANPEPSASRVDATHEHALHLEGSRRLEAEGPLDLLVWPESAYPRALLRPLPIDGTTIRGDLETPILFGANSVVVQEGRRAATNSVFLVEANGEIAQAYDKQRLIPLAEAAPDALPVGLAERFLPQARRFAAGPARDALRLGAHRLATPICFEVADARGVRESVVEGEATLLVTVADDAWFGRSREPAMHLALARLRAIEMRRWLVRATSTGHSAFVDPTGRIVARTALFERAELRGTVHSLSTTTLYARLGSWPAWVAGAMLVFGIVRRRR